MEGKSAFWGTILASIITVAGSYYIYYDDKREEKKKIKAEIAKVEQEKKNSIARVSIEEIFLPSINTEMDSMLFLKLSNNSYNDAKDLNIKINFGETKVINCEIQPKPPKDIPIRFSIYNYSLKELKKDDSLYIYCSMKTPIFDSVLITGSNLEENTKLTFNSYKIKNNKIDIKKDDGITFFEFLFRAVLFVFTIYFTITSMTLISRKLKITI